MFVCLFVWLFVCLFVCLFACLFGCCCVRCCRLCVYSCLVPSPSAPLDAGATVLRGIARKVAGAPQLRGRLRDSARIERPTRDRLFVQRLLFYVRDWGAQPPSQLARPFGHRVADASALRQRAGAASWKRSVAQAQMWVTEMGTEICSNFWVYPVMRKVGVSLSRRALTTLQLCAQRAQAARASFVM